MNIHINKNKLTQEQDMWAILSFGNFCVRPRTRVKPPPLPFQDTFQVKKGGTILASVRYLFIYLFIYLFNYIFIYLFVCLYIYLFINSNYLFTSFILLFLFLFILLFPQKKASIKMSSIYCSNTDIMCSDLDCCRCGSRLAGSWIGIPYFNRRYQWQITCIFVSACCHSNRCWRMLRYRKVCKSLVQVKNRHIL